MMKRWVLPLSVGLGSLTVGAGITTAIILPSALKAKDALSSFVSEGGEKNSLAGKEEIKIVALGDSLTAGYNTNIGYDYLSYADFLAQSFVNAGRTVDYKNFAQSGLRLADFKTVVFEDPTVASELTEADLVLMTIGSNDILAYTEFLGLPYNLIFEVQNAMYEEGGEDLSNYVFEVSESTRSTIFVDSEQSWSKEESYALVKDTVDHLESILLEGKWENLININEDWQEPIFDLVERDIATLTRDLHEAAPKAQIVLLGPPMPFKQMPDQAINAPKENMINSWSIQEAFDELLNSMEKGLEATIGEPNDYADFYRVDELTDFVAINTDVSSALNDSEFKDVAMPNVNDIHPSVAGYAAIGKSLFDIYGAENGADTTKYQEATEYDPSSSPEFQKIDEEPDDLAANKASISVFESLEDIIGEGITTINDIVECFEVLIGNDVSWNLAIIYLTMIISIEESSIEEIFNLVFRSDLSLSKLSELKANIDDNSVSETEQFEMAINALIDLGIFAFFG